MFDMLELDRTHHFIMSTFVKTGRGHHYTDIAREFDVHPDEGKRMLHALMDAKLGAMWLHPGTDFIVTVGPFNNLASQYRISVHGQQKWYAP